MESSASGPQDIHNLTIFFSDGADDRIPLGGVQREVPWYDVKKDANEVPKYTRDYLERLPTIVNTRLKAMDDGIEGYREALTKTRKVHKCVVVTLVLLAILWLITSIIILVAIFKGKDFR
ncbi:hypothetical protein ONZ43_g7550 [Nemania bipapillata]|uniref:Uncharacterized protein n=1 Tax=Nemania bipapillata TaxID=110536 RepID=A0ACC2HQJ5_9PEZI|nr:hypothetical protein ONZ43_g7550 [Nemania bipapillata]